MRQPRDLAVAQGRLERIVLRCEMAAEVEVDVVPELRAHAPAAFPECPPESQPGTPWPSPCIVSAEGRGRGERRRRLHRRRSATGPRALALRGPVGDGYGGCRGGYRSTEGAEPGSGRPADSDIRQTAKPPTTAAAIM
ncbi:hypothetical protein TNCT1_29200 [Streptomyces sp. 1-11]|nr:hypothetical protein TNCT1_29200 [Streptomyces sp. 1-11]